MVFKFWFKVHEYDLWNVNSIYLPSKFNTVPKMEQRGITVLSKPSFLSIWLLNESITTKIACLGLSTYWYNYYYKKILQNNVGKCVSVLNHPVTRWHWQPNNAAKFRRYEASRRLVGRYSPGNWRMGTHWELCYHICVCHWGIMERANCNGLKRFCWF